MVNKGSMFKTVIMKQITDSSGAEISFKKKDESFIIQAAESPLELQKSGRNVINSYLQSC